MWNSIVSFFSKDKKQSDQLWVEEPILKNLVLKSKVNKIIVDTKSKFQKIQIIDTEPFGYQLILDGYIQSSESDDHTYHESLVHPALLLHPNPQTVFIAGGGELATAREVLKHKSVKKVIMVDIDEQVVQVCRKYLGERWDILGVEKDPRFELVIEDAKKYIEEYKGGKFDVVIMDLVDPLAESPATELYYTDFYETLKTKLNTDAIFVTQAGPAGILSHTQSFTIIHNTLKKCFSNVLPYTAFMQSFGDMWGFVLAWNNELSLTETNAKDIDKKITEKIMEGKQLHFFDGIGFIGQTNLPKYIRESCSKETRIVEPKK